jgi:hypothetical protein
MLLCSTGLRWNNEGISSLVVAVAMKKRISNLSTGCRRGDEATCASHESSAAGEGVRA